MSPPTLPSEIVTSIIWYLQDPGVPLDVAKTVSRIRDLLEFGLVNKAWRTATFHPRLWSELLNAAMSESQFLGAFSRSGALPVELYFKLPPTVNYEDNDHQSVVSRVATNNLNVARQGMRRITAIHLDLGGIKEFDGAILANLLQASTPRLHTVSIMLRSVQPMSLSDSTDSTGKGPRSQVLHMQVLKLANCVMDLRPTTLPNLETLFLGSLIASHIPAMVKPWIEASARGAVPQLRSLVFAVPKTHILQPLNNPFSRVVLPSSLHLVTLEGAIDTCTYLLQLLVINPSSRLRILAIGYSIESRHLLYFFFDAFFDYMRRGSDPLNSLSLSFVDGRLFLDFATSQRSVCLQFRPRVASDQALMIRDVLQAFNRFKARIGPVSGGARLSIELDMLEEDFAWIGIDGFAYPQPSNYLPALRQFIQNFPEVRDLYIARSSLRLKDSESPNPRWVDAVGLVAVPNTNDPKDLLLPNLEYVRVNRPGQGMQNLHATMRKYLLFRLGNEAIAARSERLFIHYGGGDLGRPATCVLLKRGREGKETSESWTRLYNEKMVAPGEQ